MNRTKLLNAISLVLVSAMAWTSHTLAQATRSHDVFLGVTHGDVDSLPSDFFLFASQSGNSDAGPLTAKRLVAPDGTVFTSSVPSIRRNTLAQIAATMLGTWTAFETLGGVGSSYRFNVVPTALENLPPGVPLITSPPDGATVGEMFDVHWTFDDPGPPETIAFQYLRNPLLDIVKVEGIPGTLNALRFETKLLAPGPQEFLELNIIRTRQLPMPSLVDSTPDLVGDSFQLRGSFQAISKPITLNVIPEPGTLALAMFGVTVLVCVRWCR